MRLMLMFGLLSASPALAGEIVLEGTTSSGDLLLSATLAEDPAFYLLRKNDRTYAKGASIDGVILAMNPWRGFYGLPQSLDWFSQSDPHEMWGSVPGVTSLVEDRTIDYEFIAIGGSGGVGLVHANTGTLVLAFDGAYYAGTCTASGSCAGAGFMVEIDGVDAGQ